MGDRIVFLPDCPLVLFVLKHRGVGAFLNLKMRNLNKRNSLNNSIEGCRSIFELKNEESKQEKPLK